MKTTEVIQMLYRKQESGEVSPMTVAFFHWVRWRSHPHGFFQGSATRIASQFSPGTKKREIESCLAELKDLGLIVRISKRGERVPRWKLTLQQSKKNPQDSERPIKQTPKKSENAPLPF